MPDYALDLLNEGDSAAINDHLKTGCAACNRELDALHAAFDGLVHSEPLAEPPPRLREEVLARIDAASVEPAGSDEPATLRGTRRWQSSAFARYAAAAAAIAACVLVTIRWVDSRKTNESDAVLAAWQERVDLIDRRLHTPDFRLVSLLGDRPKDSAITHLLYDELAGQLHVWVVRDQQLNAGSRPRVWLLGEDRAVIGGADVSKQGEWGCALIDISRSDLGRLQRISLTLETETDPSAPSQELLQSLPIDLP